MNRVVDLLVDVASLEAGRVVPKPVEVDVRDLLDARLDAWRGRAPERADDLRRRVAGGLPTVVVDREWCGKALDELIDNALKFSAPGTAVTLSATRAPDGSRVRVAVRDAGPGIAPADQELLFTSFEQVDGSATRRVGGLGPRAVVRPPGRRRRRLPAHDDLAGRAGERVRARPARGCPRAAAPAQSRVASSAAVSPGARSGPVTRSSAAPSRPRSRSTAALPPPRTTPTTMRTSRRSAWPAA